MAVKIRLRRTGAKHQPSYRVVVADARSPRDGRFIETIGHYNPRRHDAGGEPELYIDPDRALYWLDNGAQPTETTNSLLRRARLLQIRHDRDHGIDVSERVAALRRKPLVAAP
jgi:small subunit ribosomal protein S16